MDLGFNHLNLVDADGDHQYGEVIFLTNLVHLQI